MDVLEALTAARAEGRTAVLVTVLAVEGAAPSHAGAKLAVGADGAVLAGTLGCSEFDAAGVALAGEAATSPEPVLRRRLVFGHGRDQALDLFAEAHRPPPGLAVLGDTPVGRTLVDLARRIGRRAALVGPADLRPGPDDAVVLTDHDAPYVEEVLHRVLPGPAGFVGMLGSRRHAPLVVARLRETGLPEDAVRRLRSPLGLDIGSRTPEEIALSILAEVVAAERGRPGGRLGLDWS